MIMKKYKIALVDDDPVILMMIKLTLENYENIEVVTFESGEAFLKLYTIVKPDILITDYYMDSINEDAMRGSDLIIRLDQNEVNIPTIILSSQDDLKLAVELSKFQIADYIEKTKDYANRIADSIQDIIRIMGVDEELKSVEKVVQKDYNHLLKISLFMAAILLGASIFLF